MVPETTTAETPRAVSLKNLLDSVAILEAELAQAQTAERVKEIGHQIEKLQQEVFGLLGMTTSKKEDPRLLAVRQKLAEHKQEDRIFPPMNFSPAVMDTLAVFSKKELWMGKKPNRRELVFLGLLMQAGEEEKPLSAKEISSASGYSETSVIQAFRFRELKYPGLETIKDEAGEEKFMIKGGTRML